MSKKEGCREPSNETPEPMSEDNPVSVVGVGGNDYNDSQNPSIIRENLAKNITVRQNHDEIIIMFLQGMKQDQNEKLDTVVQKLDMVIEEHSSTRRSNMLVLSALKELKELIIYQKSQAVAKRSLLLK